METYSKRYVETLRGEIKNLKYERIGLITEYERLVKLTETQRKLILQYETELGIYNGEPF